MIIKSANIRSLSSNFALLNDYVHEENPDLIALQEIWGVRDGINFLLDSYHEPKLKLRKNQRGGGVGFYIKDSIIYEPLETPFIEGVIKTIGVSIKINELEKINVINIYRPPSDTTLFFEYFSNLLSQFAHQKTIMVGDMNINSLNQNMITNEYNIILRTEGFKNLIDRPTRLESRSCLDHVLSSNTRSTRTKTSIENRALSDHQIINVTIDCNLSRNIAPTNNQICISKKMLEKIKNMV